MRRSRKFRTTGRRRKSTQSTQSTRSTPSTRVHFCHFPQRANLLPDRAVVSAIVLGTRTEEEGLRRAQSSRFAQVDSSFASRDFAFLFVCIRGLFLRSLRSFLTDIALATSVAAIPYRFPVHL